MGQVEGMAQFMGDHAAHLLQFGVVVIGSSTADHGPALGDDTGLLVSPFRRGNTQHTRGGTHHVAHDGPIFIEDNVNTAVIDATDYFVDDIAVTVDQEFIAGAGDITVFTPDTQVGKAAAYRRPEC